MDDAADADAEMMKQAEREFEQIKTLTLSERDKITQLCRQYGAELVKIAAEETRRRNGKSIAYAEKVLATMTAPEPEPSSYDPFVGPPCQDFGFIRSETPDNYDFMDEDWPNRGVTNRLF